MYPHRIRLRGPWDCEPLARLAPADSRDALPPPCRMTLPCRWSEGGLTGFAGRVRFRRRFGYPGRIDAHERVWLTFGGAGARAEVTLNGVALGKHEGPEPFEFEVTALLRPRNELVVDLEGTAGQGGLWGEVALEVRCTAFLRGVRLWADRAGTLHAAGAVTGTADSPLDLYLVVDRSTAAYTTVVPAAEGQPFELVADKLSGTGAVPVKVELVSGATVWYRVDQEIVFEAGG
jgi:hypothetical protein